jgi:hypothetical protein
VAERYTLIGELQEALRRLGFLRKPGQASPAAVSPHASAEDTIPPAVADAATPMARPRLTKRGSSALHIVRLVVMWFSGAMVCVAVVMIVTLGVQLDGDWAAGLAIGGLFGGLWAGLHGGGLATGKARWIVPAAMGGFVVFVLGAALTPPTEDTGVTQRSGSMTEDPTPTFASATLQPSVPTHTVAPPTAAPTPTAAPQPPTATPQPDLASRAAKSISDNRDASKDFSNQDNLTVAFDEDNGHLRLSIRPNKPTRDTELLSNASALSIVAGKAIWSTYAEVSIVSLVVFKGSSESPTPMASAIFTRLTADEIEWSSLRDATAVDNKATLCRADFYALNGSLWRSLGDKGCMLSAEGGVNVGISGRSYSVDSPDGPIPLRTLRQAEVLQYLLAFQSVSEPGGQTLRTYKNVSEDFGRGYISIPDYYNFILEVRESYESLASAALRLSTPPGMGSASDGLWATLQNRADGLEHIAKYINKGDLEEQRKASVDLAEADRAVLASVAALLEGIVGAGMNFEATMNTVVCDQEGRRCEFRRPAVPDSFFAE